MAKKTTQKTQKATKKQRKKIKIVMDEFKRSELPIGKSKKKVKNRKQALAIALSESGLSGPKKKKTRLMRKKRKK